MRYADPAAWLVKHTVATALEEASPTSLLNPPSAPVGIIGVSEYATRQSLREVARGASEGAVSPSRFVAASPGTLVGLSCTEFGFRGPSLLLTMPTGPGRELALTLAREWLSSSPQAAAAVAITTYTVTEPDGHVATCQFFTLRSQPSEMAVL
jgi:hypothetical protein